MPATRAACCGIRRRGRPAQEESRSHRERNGQERGRSHIRRRPLLNLWAVVLLTFSQSPNSVRVNSSVS